MRLSAIAALTVAAVLTTACTTPDISVAPKATPSPTPTATESPRGDGTSTTPDGESSEETSIFSERGLFPVGVTTLSVGERLAEVWYPGDVASVGDRPTEKFDVSDTFPSQLLPFLPEILAPIVDTTAYRDLPAASSGPYPVLLFSHDSPSVRQQSTKLLTHLASWGFVVLSVDHLERGFESHAEALVDPESAPVADAVKDSAGRDEFDIQNALNQLETANETPGSLLEGVVDLERLAVSGQGAGSSTAWRLAELDAIDTVIALSAVEPVQLRGDVEGIVSVAAPGVPAGTYTLEILDIDDTISLSLDGVRDTVPVGSFVLSPSEGGQLQVEIDPDTLTPGSLQVEIRIGDKPALVVGGSDDSLVPPARTEAIYAQAGLPRRLVSIAGAGHGSFSDACIEIRNRGGLQATLGDAAAELEELTSVEPASCTPESADPTAVQAITAHFMIAHLLDVFDMADVGGALDPTTVTALTGVELADFRTASG